MKCHPNIMMKVGDIESLDSLPKKEGLRRGNPNMKGRVGGGWFKYLWNSNRGVFQRIQLGK